MENLALIDSFSEFKDDKLIVTLMAILEDVFRNLKKNTVQTIISISYKSDKGDMEIWRRRVVVADEDLDFENEEIMKQAEARKIEPDLKSVKMFLKR
jgi:N utilization substance protein A